MTSRNHESTQTDVEPMSSIDGQALKPAPKSDAEIADSIIQDMGEVAGQPSKRGGFRVNLSEAANSTMELVQEMTGLSRSETIELALFLALKAKKTDVGEAYDMIVMSKRSQVVAFWSDEPGT